jgi:hypothetical protein
MYQEAEINPSACRNNKTINMHGTERDISGQIWTYKDFLRQKKTHYESAASPETKTEPKTHAEPFR